MHENYLFEYAVIRIVPRVEREEFLNVGVILYCAKQKFLQTVFTLDEQRLFALYNEINLPEVKLHLCAFEQISLGDLNAGTIARLDIASRFRWLTATRSTVVQTSKTHPGFTTNPLETLLRLHQQLVL